MKREASQKLDVEFVISFFSNAFYVFLNGVEIGCGVFYLYFFKISTLLAS
jgi:hypothetical protein